MRLVTGVEFTPALVEISTRLMAVTMLSEAV